MSAGVFTAIEQFNIPFAKRSVHTNFLNIYFGIVIAYKQSFAPVIAVHDKILLLLKNNNMFPENTMLSSRQNDV